MNQYEEHLAHSAPCSSRFDGFCRGDIGNDEPDQGQRVIGRMTSAGGYRVTVTEYWCDFDSLFVVDIDGNEVHRTFDRDDAIRVGRLLVRG